MVDQTDCQKAYFYKEDPQRFYWLTRNTLMRLSQQILFYDVGISPGQKVLEIGCGEGANLYGFKDSPAHFFGIDRYGKKLLFARQHNRFARFITADALDLPFSDNAFDVVFCKDVLHHIEHKEKTVSEMVRVCRPGGRVVLIEANGKNLLWRVFGSVVPAERGVKGNSMESLVKLFCVHQTNPQVIQNDFIYVPLLCIFLSHYKFGWQNLGNKKLFLKLCTASNVCVKRYMPRQVYPYILVSMVKAA